MRTYSYSTSAIMFMDDGSTEVNTSCGVLVAENLKEAKDRSLSIAYINYPTNLGYVGQISQVFEFTSITLDNIRREYVGQ